MDTRRARREELEEVGALLSGCGLAALPAGIPVSNVLVGIEAGAIVGTAALEVAARRGLVVAVAASDGDAPAGTAGSLLGSLIARAHELGLRELYAFADGAPEMFEHFGFAAVSEGTVPDEIRFLRSYPAGDGQDGVLCLALRTRL